MDQNPEPRRKGSFRQKREHHCVTRGEKKERKGGYRKGGRWLLHFLEDSYAQFGDGGKKRKGLKKVRKV